MGSRFSSQWPPVMPSAGPLTCMCGPGTMPCVDGIAQVHIGIPAGADIANGGEPGQQGGARVGHALDGLFRVRLGQLEVGIEVGLAGDVGVHVDQAGHHRHAAEVNHFVSRLGGH